MMKTKKCFLFLGILWFSQALLLVSLAQAQTRRIHTVTRIYDSLQSHHIEHPKTVLAIAIYETGWMKCKDCAFEDNNNLFGFRTNSNFLKFSTIYESIKYMKRWQTKYYTPWKQRNPKSTYYEYLKYIRYCDNMDNYIREIKSIEQWIAANIKDKSSLPTRDVTVR